MTDIQEPAEELDEYAVADWTAPGQRKARVEAPGRSSGIPAGVRCEHGQSPAGASRHRRWPFLSPDPGPSYRPADRGRPRERK